MIAGIELTRWPFIVAAVALALAGLALLGCSMRGRR